MAVMSERIYLGAEADVRAEDFLGRPAVAKIRLAKEYRHPELDRRLRRERTRAEAHLMAEARAAGVAVPAVLDVDAEATTLRMARVGGRRLRDAMEEEPARAAPWAEEFGRLVGRLHAAGLVHGDLTTSNLHVEGDRLVLMDFGLAGRSRDVEDRGVDLHLVERTFESSHPGRPELLRAFLQGYRASLPEAPAVERRMRDIKARARYA